MVIYIQHSLPLLFPLKDLIDVVRDQLYGADYKEEEDPRKYVSQKTDRGPLGDNWINEYWDMCKVKRFWRICAWQIWNIIFFIIIFITFYE